MGKKNKGIEVDPSADRAASESNFGENRQSQREGGAIKTQVQADESETGAAQGWRDQRSCGKGEKKWRLLIYFGGV